MNLGALHPTRRDGSEPFHAASTSLGFDLLSFWQWSCSDLCSNLLRGMLAEYLVAQAVAAGGGVRNEWDARDVTTAGGTKVEVKASAYIQTWGQKRLSRISFDIGPKKAWDAASNVSATSAIRTADLYVFALFAHRDKATVDPLEVAQREFYVLPSAMLDERCPTQKRIRCRRCRSWGR